MAVEAPCVLNVRGMIIRSNIENWFAEFTAALEENPPIADAGDIQKRTEGARCRCGKQIESWAHQLANRDGGGRACNSGEGHAGSIGCGNGKPWSTVLKPA